MPLWEGGKFYIIFGLAYPAGMFAAMQVAELWLDHLPAPVGAASTRCRRRHTALL